MYSVFIVLSFISYIHFPLFIYFLYIIVFFRRDAFKTSSFSMFTLISSIRLVRVALIYYQRTSIIEWRICW